MVQDSNPAVVFGIQSIFHDKISQYPAIIKRKLIDGTSSIASKQDYTLQVCEGREMNTRHLNTFCKVNSQVFFTLI